MGAGTQYTVRGGTNPWARTARADQSGPRAWNHGAYSGAEWLEATTVPFRVVVKGDTRDMAAWLQAHNQLQAAFDPVGDTPIEEELRFAIGGTEYVMFGRPRMVEPDTNTIVLGHSETRCVFVALDPRIYSGVEQITTMGLPVFSSGLVVPVYVPVYVQGVKVGGEALVTNDGLADTPLRLRIDGPVPEPSVTVLRPDGGVETLRVLFDLDAGQWLDIDTGSHSVLLNGVANRRGQVTGVFPLLPPGESTVAFNSSESNEIALLTVRWRHAW